MPGIPDPAEPVWDKFLGFLEPDVVPDTGAAADAELRKLGVDPGAAQARVLAAVRRAKAKQELAAAKERAVAVQARLVAVPSSVEQMTRDRIKQLIYERCDQATHQAYFRKLDAASTDADLRAILDDLDCLNHIAGGEADGGKPGE